MKVLVIPDIHLKPYIFDRAKYLLREGIADKAVCLMDIADDWNMQYQLEKYEETYDVAISFAKEFPESLWCYGNHDLSYLWSEPETGYSVLAKSIVQKKLFELNVTLPNDNPIKYVQSIDNVIFSHGGISSYFVEKYVPGSKQDDLAFVLDRINSLGHYELWCDDSPIWFRPQYNASRMYNADNVLQVVGHTPVTAIEKKNNVISCDVFSTYSDGRPIGTQEYLLVDTVTWDFCGVK